LAKVVGPALSLRASGNLGAINYTEWRGTAIARELNPCVQPNNPKQEAVQDKLASVQTAWGMTLSSSDRALWDELARTMSWSDRMSVRWTPAGYHLFLKTNCQALALGGVIQVTPPTSFPWTIPARFDCTYVSSVPKIAVRMDQFPVGEEPDLIQVFRAGPFDTGGRRAIKSDYRQKALQPSPYIYADTAIVALKWYWYRVRWGYKIGIVGNYFDLQAQAA